MTVQDGKKDKISIHAPREGSDPIAYPGINQTDGISIHAPREGSDTQPIAYNLAIR